ncbi:uncharacterized protein LOC144716241 [Wolffia australiana]
MGLKTHVDKNYDELKSEIKDFLAETRQRYEVLEETNRQHEDTIRQLTEMVLTLKLKVEKLEESPSNRPNSDDGENHSLPQPRFDGSRREDAVADFLYDCDRYFGNRELLDERKVMRASYFLTDEAKLWWRQREDYGNWPPPTYEDLVREIKESFMLHNTTWIAREELENLKMTELERRHCRDLNSAYKVVESMELHPTRPAKAEDKPVKGNKPRLECGDALAVPSNQGLKRKFKPGHYKSPRLWKQNPGGGGNKLTCFACGGPPFMKDCPRGTLAATNVNAMIVPPAEPDVLGGSSMVTLNPLQCLAALQMGAPVQYEGLNLVHILVLINGKPSTAMIDTGVTHNILAEKEAKKLSLKLSPSAGKIKAVTSEARDIVGMAKGVLLQVGTLGDTHYFSRMDLKSGYHQVQMKEGDELKMAYSMDDHDPHLRKVREHELYLNPNKCEFTLHEIEFLGHLAGKESVRMDLSKDGHPVAYESRKLNDAERRYSVHEKEMTVVVHCLRVWRHYLLGGKFVVYTDNVATSCFESQKNLTPKQARWQDFLAEFDFNLKYKPGHANQVVDALSRKEPEVFVAALLAVQGSILDEIKLALKDDPKAVRLMKRITTGETRRF